MRQFILLLIAILGFMPLAVAQDIASDIGRAENYLRNLSTVKADFIQTAHNGAKLSGTFYLNRPGTVSYTHLTLPTTSRV